MSSTPEQPVPTQTAPRPPAPTAPPVTVGPKPPASAGSAAVALDATMNAEIEAAMRDLEATGAARPRPAPKAAAPAPGTRGPRVVQAGREHRPGTVVSVGPTDVFIEFGPKELGVVPRIQWTEGQEPPKVGEKIEVVVDHFEAGESLFICSRPGLVRKADWEMLEPGQVIEARVSGVNKGGLELEVAGHTAFMPASQVSLDHIPDLSVFVGEKMKCTVHRVDRGGRGNIVLSRRDLLEQERKEHADKMKATLAEGQVVEGTVRKIMAFGAFVDLGGVDGLVHISDLSHERVGHGERSVGRHVKVGEKVKVQILKVDWAAGRLSLGLKQVHADPFATAAAADVKEGAEVTGRVTKIMEFGAFVEVAPGVEGLVHISELAWRRVGRVEEVLKPDEVVKVKVLKVDPETRRVGLSIKALTPPPEQPKPSGGRGRREPAGRSLEEISAVSPELRRLREKFGGKSLKGGIA
ncbi:MAG: S1 RNA-binding domain-containing protein [Phycisphaerales bacterium]|nr:S1 RNA-binding domain-containing protein [Phycisphaerales bacterium]